MFGGRKPQGFTIIEVLIFLGVSGLIFLTVVVFINGQIDKTQFNQGLHQFATQLQTITNNVKDGYYPSFDDFTCRAPTTGTPGRDIFPFITTRVGTVGVRGTNGGCTFIGLVLQFNPTGTIVPASSQPNNQVATLYTVVGRQFTDQDIPHIREAGLVTNLTAAEPLIIGTAVNPTIDTTQINLPPGFQYQQISYNNSTSPLNVQYDSMIGFFSSFPGGEGDSLATGSQSYDLIPVPSNPSSSGALASEFVPQSATFCSVMQMQNDGTDNIISTTTVPGNPDPGPCNNTPAITVQNPLEGVQICLKSNGVKNTWGIINIGGVSNSSTATPNNPFNIQESVYTGPTCPTQPKP